MTTNGSSVPYYINSGFRDEELNPSPYIPHYKTQQPVLSLPVYAIRTVSTQATSAPGLPQNGHVHTERKTKCVYIIALVIGICILLAIAAVLTWYFLWFGFGDGMNCAVRTSCLDADQKCDGETNLSERQAEVQSFRLYGPDFALQAYSADSMSWKPVCADGWNDDYGRAACQQIGYNIETYVGSGQMLSRPRDCTGCVRIGPGAHLRGPVKENLISSDSCPGDAVVTLRCIDCGSRVLTSGVRIIGGQVAERGAWPWQVSLHADSEHQCGGSIITPFWIVTAAHCVEEYSDPLQWTVYAGYLTQNDMSPSNGKAVSRIISHNYNIVTNDNDIALMKLSESLTMSDAIRPVCLPNVDVHFAAPMQCWISGWGATVNFGQPSNVLMAAQVSLIDRETCNSPQVYDGEITETMMCAGRLEGGVDACQGDSGGPLVAEQNSIWWLVGDTSFGIGCGFKNKPGVYGNVTFFLDWIYEQMQNN